MQKLTTNLPHVLPKDMKAALHASTEALASWDTLTDITKNEWICWVTIVKKEETRTLHIKRMAEDLKNGERRPCCWPGCPHRNPNAAKYFHPKPKRA